MKKTLKRDWRMIVIGGAITGLFVGIAFGILGFDLKAVPGGFIGRIIVTGAIYIFTRRLLDPLLTPFIEPNVPTGAVPDTQVLTQVAAEKRSAESGNQPPSGETRR